MRPLF